ncbi:MAG: helix-turn-helix transcriptional regulator [Chryseolinea sp.]
MNTTINERFRIMIETIAPSTCNFAVCMGVSPTVIYNVVKGRNEPSFKLLRKVALTYPVVNLRWLVLGLGDVLNEQTE